MNATRTETRHTEAGTALPTWGFLTNYALLLAYVVMHPDSTVRAISRGIGITERAALAILRDIDDEGIIDRHRGGRRNTYSVNFERLAAVRRGGTTSALTPRLFVNGIINMLFELANQHDIDVARSTSPRKVHEHELEPRIGTWGFFTNHTLVLLGIAHDQSQTVRELAAVAGITERAIVGIVNQLEADSIISRRREGRRTTYAIDFEAFRSFRGWDYGEWSIPMPLIDAATVAIEGLGAQ